MGQQQLLLILLGVIIIAIALAIGLTMFTDNAVSTNRDALTNDLVALAARAQTFYRKPTIFGGGGNSFTGITIDMLTARPSNANGSYALGPVAPGQMVITGTGMEKGDDGNFLSVTMTVFPDSTAVQTNN
jgi:hypothetical protein